MLLQSLVRVLYCPVVAPLFCSSVRLSPTGPVVSMVLFHWTIDVPTGSAVNYGILLRSSERLVLWSYIVVRWCRAECSGQLVVSDCKIRQLM